MRACWSRQLAPISKCGTSRWRSFNNSTLRQAKTGALGETKARSKHIVTSHTILSGIQPTGVPHLGNYLGALRQWKDFQDESNTLSSSKQSQPSHNLYYSVVDLHALTGSVDGADRHRLRKESFASLLAIGLLPKHSTLFLQSDIPHHTELMWILSTIASTGYLSRMTQWKSKLSLNPNATLFSDAVTEKLKLGLFSYPVLQAADILLYKPTLVPVGEDQAQHIEFARTLARSFNAHFGPLPLQSSETLNDRVSQKFVFDTIPEALISPAERIMSLRQPAKKMSKSDADSKSRILITDTADDIRSKLKSAVTDSEEGISYDRQRRPGISNLVEVLKHVTRSELMCEEIAIQHRNMSKQAFKELVADAIITELNGVRERFLDAMKPGGLELREAYEDGKQKAMKRAEGTMGEVRKTLGLEPLI